LPGRWAPWPDRAARVAREAPPRRTRTAPSRARGTTSLPVRGRVGRTATAGEISVVGGAGARAGAACSAGTASTGESAGWSGAGPVGGVPGGGDLDLVAGVQHGAGGGAGGGGQAAGRAAVVEAAAGGGVGGVGPGGRWCEQDGEDDGRAGRGGHEGATSKGRARHGFLQREGVTGGAGSAVRGSRRPLPLGRPTCQGFGDPSP